MGLDEVTLTLGKTCGRERVSDRSIDSDGYSMLNLFVGEVGGLQAVAPVRDFGL